MGFFSSSPGSRNTYYCTTGDTNYYYQASVSGSNNSATHNNATASSCCASEFVENYCIHEIHQWSRLAENLLKTARNTGNIIAKCTGEIPSGLSFLKHLQISIYCIFWMYMYNFSYVYYYYFILYLYAYMFKGILLLVCIITELTKIKYLYVFCLKKVTPVPFGFGAVMLFLWWICSPLNSAAKFAITKKTALVAFSSTSLLSLTRVSVLVCVLREILITQG